MKRTYDAPTRTFTWIFGGTVPDLTYTVPAIVSDDPTAEPALLNGYAQKIGDAAAIARNKETGKSATDQDKYDAMLLVRDRLVAGHWNAEKAAVGKGKAIDVAALVAAIVVIRQRPEAAVRAFVESKTEEQRFALAMADEFRLEYAMQCVKIRPVAVLDDATLAEIDAIAA